MSLLISLLIIFSAAFVLTGLVRYYTLKKSILDIPNERSSHRKPTPRGGGLAIIFIFIASILILSLWHPDFTSVIWALAGGTLVVAGIGFLDDLYGVAARWRMLVHLFAACWALYWLQGFPILTIGLWQIHLGWVGIPIAMVGIMWFINLYNFMDGIDGLAGMEAVFVALGAGIMLWLIGNVPFALMCFFLAAAAGGFLVWNWPPAKIFMGDMGSGALGYIFAVLLIATANTHVMAPPVWIILLAIFIFDATFTLVKRIYRKEPLYQAHRSHAYQEAVARGKSHKQVTLTALLINIVILLPCAFISFIYPVLTLPILILLLAAGGVLWYGVIKQKIIS